MRINDSMQQPERYRRIFEMSKNKRFVCDWWTKWCKIMLFESIKRVADVKITYSFEIQNKQTKKMNKTHAAQEWLPVFLNLMLAWSRHSHSIPFQLDSNRKRFVCCHCYQCCLASICFLLNFSVFLCTNIGVCAMPTISYQY